MEHALREIRIAAAVVLDADGRMLLVKKRGSPFFMQPGGKIEAGETPVVALRRELAEEVSLDLSDVSAEGVFSAPAANEPGASVVAHVFSARTNRAPHIGCVGSFSPSLYVGESAEGMRGRIACEVLCRSHCKVVWKGEWGFCSLGWCGDDRERRSIDALHWLDLADPAALPLAPLTRDHMVPLARQLAAKPGGELR